MKPKRKMTAAQLANLRPIKKGEVRNPHGNQSPVLKALRNLTEETFAQVITLFLSSSDKELEAFMSHPETTTFQKGLAKALLQAAKHGNWPMLEHIAERIVGKVPIKMNLNSNNQTQLSVIDENQAREIMKKIQSDV